MILMSCILLFCFLDQPFGAEVFPFFHGTVIDFAMRLCSLQLAEKSLHEAFCFQTNGLTFEVLLSSFVSETDLTSIDDRLIPLFPF